MPNSIELPRGIVTAHCTARAARCLLMSCLTWALSSKMLLLDSFCGSHEVQARRAELRTTMKVRERLGSLSRPKSKNQKPDDLKDEVRQLNSRLKQAGSEAELIGILEEKVDAPFFDPIHASTAFHKLATFKQTEGSLPICAVNPAFLRLNARMKDFLKQNQVKSWASANLLWAIAILGNELSIVVSLLPNLVKSFGARASGMTEQELSNCLLSAARLKLKGVAPEEAMNIAAVLADRIPGKADGMNAQELSNCLWACANLIDVAPDAVAIIVPAVCDQIPGKVSDMIPQHVSNCLWAAGQLKDVARDDAVKIVPVLLAELPSKAKAMGPQNFANSLQGLVFLEDFAPEVGSRLTAPAGSKERFLRLAASHITEMLPRLKGSDLYLAVPVVVWACAKSGLSSQTLLTAVAQRFGSNGQSSRLPDWDLCALTWSYQTLDQTGRFGGFQQALRAEVVRRGLSDSDVERSKDGQYAEFAGDK
ncbi:unnamed protein product [Durusdinium trenchii]